MEKYYFVVVLNAMTKALDIPTEDNAIDSFIKLRKYRENIPKKDIQTRLYIDRYINLIKCLADALDRNNDEDYDCIRSGMYAVISDFAKHVSDEIESEYF